MRGPGFTPSAQQMTPEQKRFWRCVLNAELAGALEKPVHRRAVEPAAAAETVRLGDQRQQLEIDFLRQPPECAVRNRCRRLPEHAGLQVMRHHSQHLFADVVSADRMNVQPIEHRCRRRDALLLVVDRTDPAVDKGRRRRLPDVVEQRAEHQRDLVRRVEIRRCGSAPRRRPAACGPRRPLRDATRAPAGIRPAPRSSGNSSLDDAAVRMPACRPIDGRFARAAAASRARPRCVRTAGRRAECDAAKFRGAADRA